MPAQNVLILAASYGSLLASKLLLAGHPVSLVCLPEEASLINAEGFRVRMPQSGKDHPAIDAIVALVDRRLQDNRAVSPRGRAA
jgi:ketopantoate reductase